MPPRNPDATEPGDVTEDIRSRMRRGLVAAMRVRDQQAVATLRSTLAAIDNAEAIENDEVVDDEAIDELVDGGSAPGTGGGHPAVAGSLLGVGAAEVDRRILTPEEVAEVVRDEVTEREVAAELLERVGHPDRAQHLRAQAEFLATYLDPPGPCLSS
jgi:uncharacterized protein YqeY